MISAFQVYCIMTLDNIVAFLCLICVIFVVISCFLAFATYEKFAEWTKEKAWDGDDESKSQKIAKNKYFILKKYFLLSLLVCLTSGLIATFTPSTNAAIAMYIVPKLSDSKLMQNLPDYLQAYIQKEIKVSPDKND